MKIRGRLSFEDASARRIAEQHVAQLVAAGLAPEAVRVDGLTMLLSAEAPDDPRLSSTLRMLARAAWAGALHCHAEGSVALDVLHAGGPDERGVRALGSLPPVVHASRFRGELARGGIQGDPATYRFDRRDCSVLVVYALSASHDKPDDDDPRWVYGTVPAGIGLMAAQPAPMTRIMRRADFFEALHDAVAEPQLDAWAAVHLGECLRWAAETGCLWFAYMLEPVAIAGDGRAVALAHAASEAAAAQPPAAGMVGAETIAAVRVDSKGPWPSTPTPEPPIVKSASGTAPSGPVAWSETPTASQYVTVTGAELRAALLRALCRNIGESGLVVARRAAEHAHQCGSLAEALSQLLALINDPMGLPVTRGDALFAIAVLGVERGVTLPEVAFAPLLDGTLRAMVVDDERRPGFEGLLGLAPRTAAYEALRLSLGLR